LQRGLTSDFALYHVVEAATGKSLVKEDGRAYMFSSPAVVNDTVFFSSPLVANGIVYFGSTDGFMYAIE
jgi:outer membrane protein assembly factor BamB